VNATDDIHSSDVPSTEYGYSLKSCCVLHDHYDDDRDTTIFLNATSDLQDQDHSMQEDQDRFFGLRPVLSQDQRSQTTLLAFTVVMINILQYYCGDGKKITVITCDGENS